MSRVGRSFSLDDEKDVKILEYYDKIKNKSEYIKNLILSDMKIKSSFTKEQKDEIRELFSDLIKEYANNHELSIDKVKEEFDLDAIDALDQFED